MGQLALGLTGGWGGGRVLHPQHLRLPTAGGGGPVPCRLSGNTCNLAPAAHSSPLLPAALALPAAWQPPAAAAIELGFKKDLTNKRKQRIPESDYTDGEQGLK